MFKNKKGFTLVELLAVIVILAIILAIAIPGISGIITSAKKGAFESDAKMIITGIEYKVLEASMGNGTAPTVSGVPIIGTGLSVLDDYGANSSNYTSFEIISMTPVEIEITSKSTSEFGLYSGAGTKSTFAILP